MDPIDSNPLIVVPDAEERLAEFERNIWDADPIPYDSIDEDAVRYFSEAEIPVDVMAKVHSREAYTSQPGLIYEVVTRLSRVLS